MAPHVPNTERWIETKALETAQQLVRRAEILVCRSSEVLQRLDRAEAQLEILHRRAVEALTARQRGGA